MKPDKKLSGIFARFAGEEVAVIERDCVIGDGFIGRVFVHTDCELPEGSAVLAEMHQTARENGLFLRVLLPNDSATADFNSNRANAYIRKDSEGKWRVSPDFRLG
jgi:hypothetical protein